MANFGPLLFSILSLLLLANMIIAAGSGGGGSGNGNEENERPGRSLLQYGPLRFLLSLDLDPCQAGVSNDACCEAIENGIGSQGCSFVCKVLLDYGAPALITNCTRYPKCRECPPCYNSPPESGGPSADYDQSS